jgi:pSer/pThr/pTyr-binding forkhead associated (FHA) protein
MDLESTNGTYLNGSLVSEGVQLNNNDQIRIGELVFQVEISVPETAEQTQVMEKDELPLEKTFVVTSETDNPWLVVSSGPGKGTMFTITKKNVQIGRASRNKQWDIDLVDKSVSRPHAEIFHEGENWVLKDLGSANGTTVNGNLIGEPHAITDGDVLAFGEIVLIFRTNGGN